LEISTGKFAAGWASRTLEVPFPSLEDRGLSGVAPGSFSISSTAQGYSEGHPPLSEDRLPPEDWPAEPRLVQPTCGVLICAGTKSRALTRFVVTCLYRRRGLCSFFRRSEAPAERRSCHDEYGKRSPHCSHPTGNVRCGLGRAFSKRRINKCRRGRTLAQPNRTF
jgi:hypothetical protein